MEYTELKRELRVKVQERINYEKDLSDREVEDTIDEVLLGQENLVTYPVEVRRRLKTLRMRPDRIIVGEVRGAEAIDMLQCMNTGHLGLASLIPVLRTAAINSLYAGNIIIEVE